MYRFYEELQCIYSHTFPCHMKILRHFDTEAIILSAVLHGVKLGISLSDKNIRVI
jgi:hypothetical protein